LSKQNLERNTLTFLKKGADKEREKGEGILIYKRSSLPNKKNLIR